MHQFPPISPGKTYCSILLAILFALLPYPTARAAESAPPAATRYEKRADHDPDGIGVFYLGREIAHVMGHQAADWLERPEREQEERTDLLISALKFQPGEIVADIGCGSGYIARKIAPLIQPDGLVYGVDIQPEMLTLLAQRMAQFKIKNVTPILGTANDPRLPTDSIDTIIMVDVYHEFDQPYEMIRNMIPALKKGGRIVFVEYRLEDPAVPIKTVHKMSLVQVKKEMAIHPEMEFSENLTVLPLQHLITFRKK